MMTPLTDAQIRASFVNTTRKEVADATLPDLDTVRWDRIEYLGWRDRKAPLRAYAVVEVDGEVVGLALRAADAGGAPRRQAMCGWCEDVVEVDDVTMYVAKRAGSAGRKGDTIGTLLCTELTCSRNVRRRPSATEAGSNVEEVRELIVAERIAGLQERSQQFARAVLATR